MNSRHFSYIPLIALCRISRSSLSPISPVCVSDDISRYSASSCFSEHAFSSLSSSGSDTAGGNSSSDSCMSSTNAPRSSSRSSSSKKSAKAQARSWRYYLLIIWKDSLQTKPTRISPSCSSRSDSPLQRPRRLKKPSIPICRCPRYWRISSITILPANAIDASRYRRTV